MKKANHVLFVTMLVVIFVGIFVITINLIPTKSGNGNDSKGYVVGISNVSLNQNNFLVNQPLSVENAKIYLELNDDTQKQVNLELTNITNFSTAKVGTFQFDVYYNGFSFKVPYTVSYKKLGVLYSNLDFEIGEDVDYSKFNVSCFDYNDQVVALKPFTECEIENLSTDEISSKKTASLSYANLSTTFDYSVSYFSSMANYVGSVEDGDFKYHVLEFSPTTGGKLKVAKEIVSIGAYEDIYTYDLKKLENGGEWIFLSDKSLAKFGNDKKLTIFKDVAGNEKEIEIALSRNNVQKESLPRVKDIVAVEGLKNQFIMNEIYEPESVSVTLQLYNGEKTIVTADKIENLRTSNVGDFVAKVKYKSFSFDFDYQVGYKKIELYFADGVVDLEFNVGQSIGDYYITCFDNQDYAVAILQLNNSNIIVENFDTSSVTSATKTATIYCYGAKLSFEYSVV